MTSTVKTISRVRKSVRVTPVRLSSCLWSVMTEIEAQTCNKVDFSGRK